MTPVDYVEEDFVPFEELQTNIIEDRFDLMFAVVVVCLLTICAIVWVMI